MFIDPLSLNLFLSSNPVTTSRAVATQFNVPLATARKELDRLAKEGKLAARGVRRGRTYVVVLPG
jgi:Fic family protein